ncbi:MAG: histone deacetylase family protein [Thermoprotei archaeon]|nr:MAG: histone deacetylase family protein [Thermoprotei archaeon]
MRSTSQKFCIGYSEVFLDHKPPPQTYHPENPERLTIAIEALRREGIWNSANILSYVSTDANLAKEIHSHDYVELVRRLSSGYGWIDADTYVSPGTWRAALSALATSTKLFENNVMKRCSVALALVRPPGHHAGISGKALGAPTQGFCIFNNVAIAARRAVEMKFTPVLILDIDVHHGNGTQEIFWYSANIVHIDVHGDYLYPGTGYVHDVGGGEGEGTKINIPLPTATGDEDYVYVFKELIIPIIEVIRPRTFLVSAGFDAYQNDGLAFMNLTYRGYKVIGSIISMLSAKYSSTGILIVLEGGYSEGLDKGLPAFINGVLKPVVVEHKGREPKVGDRIIRICKKVRGIVRRYLGPI